MSLTVIRRGDKYRVAVRGSHAEPFVWDIEDGVVELRSYASSDNKEPLVLHIPVEDLRGCSLLQVNDIGTVVYRGEL